MVRNVRIDVNHFIRGGEWEINLRKSGLTTSLRSLRKLELVVNTFTTELFLATEPCGSIHPVNSVLEFPARRPSFAVVSVRRCNVYGTNDANELAENYGIEKCLERMQEILGEQQGAGKGG